jgi:hypothetical protein
VSKFTVLGNAEWLVQKYLINNKVFREFIARNLLNIAHYYKIVGATFSLCSESRVWKELL